MDIAGQFDLLLTKLKLHMRQLLSYFPGLPGHLYYTMIFRFRQEEIIPKSVLLRPKGSS